jgi:plastocyanin
MGKGIAKRLVETMLLAGVLAVVGCAGLGAPVTVKSPQQGERVVHLKVNSFKFEPNNIRVSEVGPLTLALENISDSEHNITIKNPEGQVLKSVDLPPKQTISETLDLPHPGKYEFYCAKLFHATLGMKGQIQVGP